MTREDINNIISAICPNDEDFEKPIISPKYLKAELEQLALEQEPCEDCISRAELLKAIDTWDKFGCDANTKLVPYKDHYIPYIHYDDVVKCIKQIRPSKFGGSFNLTLFPFLSPYMIKAPGSPMLSCKLLCLRPEELHVRISCFS